MRLAMAMIAMALAPQVAAQSETADITKVAEKGSREM